MLEPVAGAGHVNNLTAVDEAVKDSGGNGCLLYTSDAADEL